MSWSRRTHLDRLDDVDVAVIGGGIVGAGVALDLATRGISVAVVERHDFASGTSSKSTKLFHGGIRYLPQLRFGLIREGLREQRVLAEIADYLYRPLDFVVPLYRGVSFGDLPAFLGHHRLVSASLRMGLLLYDRLGGRNQDRHRRVSAGEARQLAPALMDDGLEGGFVYSDAQTEDARLTVAVAATAVEHGALAVNHVDVTGVAAEGDGYRLSLVDTLDGDHVELKCRAVVAAAGAVPPPTPQPIDPIALRLSRGSHIIASLTDAGLDETAVVIPETEDERILYMIPWEGHALIGTTDVETTDPSPVPSDAEIDYLVRHVERFTGRSVAPLTTFAGLRALPAGDGTAAKASRKEQLVELAPRYFQVAGGKLTGYRVIAEKVADEVASELGIRAASVTERTPLAGAGTTGAGHLHDRYGSRAVDVSDIVSKGAALGASFPDGTLLAEAVHAARNEAAATIGDVALRRTRLAWFTPDHGRSAAIELAAALGSELGWDEARRAAEIDRFSAELAAEGL